MEKKIIELFEKAWKEKTGEEFDGSYPFTTSDTWSGKAVMDFVKFVLKERIKETLELIFSLIEKNKDIINPYFTDTNIECWIDHEEKKLVIAIPTKFRKLPNRKYEEKIKKIFKADNCVYIPSLRLEDGSYQPGLEPFWAIEFNLKKRDKND